MGEHVFSEPSRLYWTVFSAWYAIRDLRLPLLAAARLRRIQDLRVRSIVRHAYRTVPHYRDVMVRLGLVPTDFRTAEDLQKLPITEGRELARHPERFLSSAVDPANCLSVDTTGTTGHYKTIHHDPRAVFLARAAGQRRRGVIARYVGRSYGYRELYVGPRGGTRDQVLRFLGQRSWAPPFLDLTRALASTAQSVQDGIDAINRHRPDVITGFGSCIGAIFRRTRLTGTDIHHSKVICYGGDHMQPADRNLIENDLGIPVISTYQSCEFLNIGYQCQPGSGFHLSVDQVALRIVDNEGRSLPPGQTGEIIISSLVNRATVLLNYRTGDLGFMSPDACSCGRNLPILADLVGRAEDPIVRADGEAVHESVILPRLYAVPGVWLAQLVQHAPESLTLRVVSAPGSDPTSMSSRLRAAVAQTIGREAGEVLHIEHVDDIPTGPGGKYRAIISERT